MAEPSTIYAGATLTFDHIDSDYTVEDWSLAYVAVNASGGFSFVTSLGNGNTFSVSVIASTTASWAAGEYQWYRVFSQVGGTECRIVEGLSWNVKADARLFLSTGLDLRSELKQDLDSLWAAFHGRATQYDLNHMIGNRSVGKMTHEQIITAIDWVKKELAKEEKARKIALGMNASGNILLRPK